jgi:hypothetical protein
MVTSGRTCLTNDKSEGKYEEFRSTPFKPSTISKEVLKESVRSESNKAEISKRRSESCQTCLVKSIQVFCKRFFSINVRAEPLSHPLPIMEGRFAGHIHKTVNVTSTPNVKELEACVSQLELDLREEKEARTRSELDRAS